MANDEARERARRRLEERQARMRGQSHGAAAASEDPIGSGRLRSSRPGTGNRHSWEARGPEALFALSDAVMNAARAIGLKRAGAIAVALVALALLLFGIRGCMSSSVPQPAPAETDQSPVEQPQPPRDPIDEAALSSILGDDLTAQLVQAAASDDDVAWIAAHPDAYAVDGEAVQLKLLRLAATEP